MYLPHHELDSIDEVVTLDLLGANRYVSPQLPYLMLCNVLISIE